MNLFRQITEKPWLEEQGAVVALRDGSTFSLSMEKVGLRVLLVVVMVLFSIMIAAYTERRVFADWNSVPIPWLLWLNTLILILSSVTMHRAWTSASRGQIEGVRFGLYAGGGLSLAFLVGQLLAWRELVGTGYYATTDPANAFFYMLTATHGVHIIGGLIAWGRTIAKVRRGYTATKIRLSVELCTIYWHFLLLIWLILLVLMVLT